MPFPTLSTDTAAYLERHAACREVVETSAAVASTRARLAKVASLAEVLGRLAPARWGRAVAFLAGELARAGSGWGGRRIAAASGARGGEPSLVTPELDET